MGAWGYRPFENDAALDWMGEWVEPPLIRAIQRTLRAYLKGSDEEIEEEAAEGAAALLFDLTSDTSRTKYKSLNLRHETKTRKLWALAIRAIDKMIADDWPNGFNDPARKLEALNELRADLERAEVESGDPTP